MKTETPFVCLATLLCFLPLTSEAHSQSITTIITPASVQWTENMALADHGAAFIARKSSAVSTNEVFAYVFAVHTLIQVTSNQVEDHALVASGNRLLWVEGRGQTSTLHEYLLTDNKHRQFQKPTGSLDLVWLDVHHHLALALDQLTGCLWQLDLDSSGWTCLSYLFRAGTDTADINGRDAVWSEPSGNDQIIQHKQESSLPVVIHRTTSAISNVKVRFPFVVWTEKRGAGSTWEIMSHDLTRSLTRQITTNQYDDTGPILVGPRLVWLAPLNGSGPIVMHHLDLSQPGSPEILPIQAQKLNAAWDGVFFSSPPWGRVLSHYNFLESRTVAVDTALDIARPDFDGSGRMVMFRKLPNQIQLFMPSFDVRPSDPFMWDTKRVGLYLFAGPLWGFYSYQVAACVSGFRPGFNIGMLNVPLNLDPILVLSVGLANVTPFENTSGKLTGYGNQLAYFNPDPGLRAALVGIDIYWAYVLVPPILASNPVRMRIRP